MIDWRKRPNIGKGFLLLRQLRHLPL